MENFRTVKFVFILIGGMLLILLAIPFFIFAYSDETTHPALTDEIVDHFNRYYPAQALSVSQKELVKLGSIEEDSGTRWLQHFYDPIYNRGLKISAKQYESSKEWSADTLTQAGLLGDSMYGSIFSLFSAQSDFSWERAVYEYAWGDKNHAMLALGHILHLIEDTSVPDHTRNDPHPHLTEWFSSLNESPYETWTKKFAPNNFTANINESPVILGGLNEYFDSMAKYSNGNFFSKDTILADYELPKIFAEKDEILSDGQSYTFGYTNKIRLVKIKNGTRWSNPEYSLVDNDNLILTDYWSHLSRQAILHGAGVMKLFFDEVAREQQTKTLYNKNRSWLQKVWDGIAGVWASFTNNTTSSAGLLATVNPAVIEVSSPSGGETLAATDATGEVGLPAGSPTSAPTENIIPTKLVALSLVSTESIVSPTPQIQNPPMVFSLGGAGPRPTTDNQQLTANNKLVTPPDTTPPDAPVITAPTETTHTTSRVLFSGTAEAGAEIFTDFNEATTTAYGEVGFPAGSPASTMIWTLALNLPQGTTTITFFAKDAAGNTSTGTAKTVFVDSDAPGIALMIDECAASLSQDGCLVATTTLALRWSSNAHDLAAYSVSCAKDGNNPCANFSYDANGTSTIFIAENNHAYAFTAAARDAYGNESFTMKTAEIRTAPVIINEIAWAGTQANEQDEWIELKNNANAAINLSGWRLYSETDGKPDIALSGIIPANGYYLIERTDDNTVSDIPADWFGSFGATADGGSGLVNTGEVLTLAYGSTTIDQTPELTCRRRWCTGDITGRKTSERIDPFIAGTNPANWATHNGIVKNGKDIAGMALNGTPKHRNSVNYTIIDLWRVQENRVLIKSNSPYLIDNDGFTIPAGKTLALEPGAVVKFVDTQSPSLFVNGTLKAEGVTEDPVVFTSLYDDEYGGDTNQDGVCNPADASSTAACPHAGSWKQILIQPTSVGTVLDHTIIRYGGRWFSNSLFRSMLAVDGAEIQLTNSTLEHSWGHGLRLVNSDSVIENNMFRYNTEHDSDTGFYIGGGSPTIRRNASSYNSVGGLISNIGGIFSDNIFTNNIHEALLVSGTIPAMTSTTASANGANGILLSSIPSSFSFQPGLPYIIESQPILSSGSYTFEAGAVLKFKSSSSGMTLGVPVAIAGTGVEPIVFTAYTDDTYGGDTNNDGVCTPEDASSTAVCPASGAWCGLKFIAGADTSALDNVIVRYGGSHSDWAGIKADGTSLSIQNSVIEENSRKGIWLFNSASTTIANTIIRDHKKPNGDATVSGLYLAGSHADIGGLTFRNNAVAINAPDVATGGSFIAITGPIDIDDSNAVKTIPPGFVP